MSQYIKQIAIIGTVGVPANYGGFETLVENLIVYNASSNVHYTIYCSSKTYSLRQKNYKGATLKYVSLKANGIQSIPYDIISIFYAVCSKADLLLILGVSGAIILPLVRLISKKRIIVNIDGLEHKRDKWGKFARKFLKFSEKIAVKNADKIISDNQAIADYVQQEYNCKSELIAYGGDHAVLTIEPQLEQQIISQYNLVRNEYSFAVCRIEPENNVHITLQAYAPLVGERLVFVGNWNNSAYGADIKKQYENYAHITLLDPIYDLDVLNVLRSNCKLYIHGHSAGGTNPSLVEAMFFQNSILCYDVCYNRESTQNEALYYSTPEELRVLIGSRSELLSQNKINMNRIANQRYLWSHIVSQYEQLY